MPKRLILKFREYVSLLSDYEYLLFGIAYRIAPTLMGIKPSSLISLIDGSRNVLQIWAEHKEEICSHLETDYLEIKTSLGRTLVLFYKKRMLARHLAAADNQEFLMKNGYPRNLKLKEKLILLKNNFEDRCPPEIGIFLGFPLNDVQAFIEHQGSQYVLCRYWKVYHHPERAEQVFRNYDLAKLMVMFAMIDPKFSLAWAGKR